MKKKKEYITILSVISAIAVVLLHTNSCFWSFSRERYWFTANIIECVCYFAVPIFFMIAGVNLLDYNERYSTKDYFIKRIKKVVIPYVVWTFIGLAYMIQKGAISIKSLNIECMLNSFIDGSNIIGVYWFIPPLLLIYLCIPIFSHIDKSKKFKIYTYISIIGIILNCLVPFAINLFGLKISMSFQFVVVSKYLLYIFIGYVLDKYDFKIRDRIIIYAMGIIGLLSHIIGTYILSSKAGYIIWTFKGYTNIPCLMYSIALFVLVKELGKHIKNYKIINFVASYTFAIYLLHWFIKDIIQRIFDINLHSIIWRLGAPFVIITICIFITYILRKIPIIKKIVP